MMNNINTFNVDSNIDPLYAKQREDVAKMRASLLACNEEDPLITKSAIRNITILRIYHQLTRIIRYTELMDKLENKLYNSIDCVLSNYADNDVESIVMLTKLQTELQKNMIESSKLLAPYMDLINTDFIELVNQQSTVSSNPTSSTLNANERERIRNSAQAVLIELNAG